MNSNSMVFTKAVLESMRRTATDLYNQRQLICSHLLLYDQVGVMEANLNRQSNQLGLALKAEADALEAHRAVTSTLQLSCAETEKCRKELEALQGRLADFERLFDSLQPQEVGTLLELPVGSDVSAAILPGIQKLKQQLADALEGRGRATTDFYAEVQAHKETTARALVAEHNLRMLEAKLKALQPPKPKFKMGQVVFHTEDNEYFQLGLYRLKAGRYEYWSPEFQDYYEESQLRAITEEEMHGPEEEQ